MPEVMSANPGTAGRVIEGTVRIAEAGAVGMISIKADLDDPALDAALREIAGVGVPQRLTAWLNGAFATVWMSTDELLVVLPADAAPEAATKLETALAETHALVADVSAARTVFRLEGVYTGEVLAKGAPLDFRDAAFPVGCARRTHLGPVAVGIWREGPQSWTLVCFRSLAPYTAEWLATAAAEGTEVNHY
ncbi:MAG: sarcosine oxidase subunit gamma family protein [Pseudomonadota bacterium]